MEHGSAWSHPLKVFSLDKRPYAALEKLRFWTINLILIDLDTIVSGLDLRYDLDFDFFIDA